MDINFTYSFPSAVSCLHHLFGIHC
uniref:Uncharacterized protein n=1 Tax=Rhizophora mucronata TaxID=61149 RepID=A0A2P2LEE4_RHIMU